MARKGTPTLPHIDIVVALREAGQTYAQIAFRYGVNEGAVHGYIKRWRPQLIAPRNKNDEPIPAGEQR